MSGVVRLDITGRVFGSLTIVGQVAEVVAGKRLWLARCSCGRDLHVRSDHVRRGAKTSCGCQTAAVRAVACVRHGAARVGHVTAEYGIWRAMIRRCENERARDYPRYGGRGIAVCARWRESFEAFLADMGPRPSAAHSIDRFPDTNGNYGPANCRWATARQQAQNRRDNHALTIDGETLCVAEWARRRGIDNRTIHDRLRRGWSPDAAVNRPVATPEESGRTANLARWTR